MSARILTIALAMGALIPSTQAGAAGPAPTLSGVALGSDVVPAGAAVTVSGTMTVAEQPAETLWNDVTVTGDLNGFDYPSEPLVDLVQGSVLRARPGDPLTLRITVAPSAVPDVPKPFTWFRWPFHLGDIWYFVEFTYVQNGAAGGWQGSWYYCRLALGNNCVHGTTPSFPVTWDAAARTFTGQIPLAAMAVVQPDGTLEADTMRPFSSQYPPQSGHKTPAATLGQDRGPAFEPHDVPIETVFLGVAPAGTNPSAVDYAATATTTGGTSLEQPFTGSVSTEGLAPGFYQLFVKGCFGPCATTSLPFFVS